MTREHAKSPEVEMSYTKLPAGVQVDGMLLMASARTLASTPRQPACVQLLAGAGEQLLGPLLCHLNRPAPCHRVSNMRGKPLCHARPTICAQPRKAVVSVSALAVTIQKLVRVSQVSLAARRDTHEKEGRRV